MWDAFPYVLTLCALAISLDLKIIKNKGKHKKFLATNEISATCTQGAQLFFLLQMVRGKSGGYFGFSCSQCVPQHVPNSTSLCAICFVKHFLSWNLYRWVTIWAFMFGVNISIWGFFKVSKLFFWWWANQRGSLQNNPLPFHPPKKKQKDLKGTPTNQYGSHYYIIFSRLMVIKLCLKMSCFFRNFLFGMWKFKRKLQGKKKIQKNWCKPHELLGLKG